MRLAIPAAPRQASLLLGLIPHLLLVAVVVGTLTRLAQVSTELCWRIAPPIVLLTVSYGVGLAVGERLGARSRSLWLGSLLALWCWVSWFLPANLAFGYAWLAVPLAILALRMFAEGTAVATVGVITVLLVACLARITGGFRLDLVAPPVAAVWATVALYRTQLRLVRELRQTREELARQQREAGKLAERARIARDLHDTLAQELAGNRMLLQAAERDWERRPEAARVQVHAVTEALGASLADTRSIIRDLTPPALRHDDLAAALRELCARKDPAADFRVLGEPRDLHPERAAALLRVAQGLLANAYEHAAATHVWLTLDHRDDQTTSIEIRDDGVGFDLPEPGPGPGPGAGSGAGAGLGLGPGAGLGLGPGAGSGSGAGSGPGPGPGPGRGLGLAAVRERLAEHGGTCMIESARGRGTRVVATLPAGVPVLAGMR